MKWLRSAWGRIRAKITRKRLKKLLSILGATIILGTFIAKDARKDKLKELVDSIETAENAYRIRSDDRTVRDELERFERTFVEFAKHPSKPLDEQFVGNDFPSPLIIPDRIDWDTYWSLFDELRADAERGTNIRLLNDRLLDNKRHSEEFQRQTKLQGVALNSLMRLQDKLLPYQGHPVEAPRDTIMNLNREIYKTADTLRYLRNQTRTIGDFILEDAEKQRAHDEAQSEVWTIRYYILYGLGWIISVIGIVLGGEEEKSIAEEIVET